MLREHYIEFHTLEWDVQHSACGECEFVDDCQYYYNNCPNQGADDL